MLTSYILSYFIVTYVIVLLLIPNYKSLGYYLEVNNYIIINNMGQYLQVKKSLLMYLLLWSLNGFLFSILFLNSSYMSFDKYWLPQFSKHKEMHQNPKANYMLQNNFLN